MVTKSMTTRRLWFLSAFRVLLENDEDRLLVVFNRGLILMTEVSSSAPVMS